MVDVFDDPRYKALEDMPEGTPSSRQGVDYSFAPEPLSKGGLQEDPFWHQACSYTIGQIRWEDNSVAVVLRAQGEVRGFVDGDHEKEIFDEKEADDYNITTDKQLNERVEWVDNNWFEIEFYYERDGERIFLSDATESFEPVFSKEEAEQAVTEELERDKFTEGDEDFIGFAEELINEVLDIKIHQAVKEKNERQQ